jgi:hypothetical protein
VLAPGPSRGWIGVKGVNTPREANDIILYTPRFGPSTRTSANGTEVVLSASGKLVPWGAKAVTVLQIRQGAGDTPLQAGQMVLSGTGSVAAELRMLEVGQTFHIDTVVLTGAGTCGPPAVEAPAWANVVETQGGNWFVARDGQVAAPSASQYPAGSVTHPRTSLGLTADGRVLMVTVDGRQPGYSIGVTLAEMGQLMVSLGAVAAFNLDGGGSTVMATRQPGAAHITVSNRPSDGRERKLTQAFAAFSVEP